MRNYIVSDCRPVWLPGAEKLFLADPYVYHVLARNGELGKYASVECATPYPSTRSWLKSEHEFIQEKLGVWLPCLIAKLDKLHGSHSQRFWEKLLLLGFMRMLTSARDCFCAASNSYDPQKHALRLVEYDASFIPTDFSVHRGLFQHKSLGRELLNAAYMDEFYPDQHEKVPYLAESENESLPPELPKWSLWQRAKRVPRKMLRKLATLREPSVGLYHAYFAPENEDRLIYSSLGGVQIVDFECFTHYSSPVDGEARRQLVQDCPRQDGFDRYFARLVESFFPRLYIEDFKAAEEHYQAQVNGRPRLTHLVNESWIGNSQSCFALAVAREKGVKHIYNEHNCLLHPFEGTSVPLFYSLVDQYATLGWKPPAGTNADSVGSLFPWKAKPSHAHEHELLFVTSVPNVHIQEFNAAFGESGPANVRHYFQFNLDFFRALGPECLRRFSYRGYPKEYTTACLIYDQEYVFRDYVPHMKKASQGLSIKELFGQTRLVVLNYLSTAYLEALVSDVPTVILFNEKSYLFNRDYMDFMDPLCECGIVQKNPDKAAQHVLDVVDAPERWWARPEVRAGRKAFLDANMRNPSRLHEFIRSLSRERSV